MFKLLTKRAIVALLISFSFNSYANYCEHYETLTIHNNSNTKITAQVNSTVLYGAVTRTLLETQSIEVNPYSSANVNVKFSFHVSSLNQLYMRKVKLLAYNSDPNVNERFGTVTMRWVSSDNNAKIITIKENYEMKGSVRNSEFNDLWSVDNADALIQSDINSFNQHTKE
ncbi:MAG: hypothetical protein HRT87_03800 [Legionellales bacterium]|nr:hypothetical protein [Legionellales bacterium]